MAKLSFRLRHHTPKHPDQVYDSLVNFKTFGRLHPFMKKVELVERTSKHTTYVVEEEVYLFGILKTKPSYQASVIELEKNKSLQYTSQVRKGVYLSIHFTFSNNGNGIYVNEEIELTCNRLVGIIFMNILKKSHRQVFRNLNAA